MCYEKRDPKIARECFIRDQGGNMDQYTAAALAYNNGYDQGYAQGKKDAAKWISIEDRPPDDSFLEKEIIVCILNRFGQRNVYTKKFWGVNSALWSNDITHWMPLPEPPMDGGNEDG